MGNPADEFGSTVDLRQLLEDDLPPDLAPPPELRAPSRADEPSPPQVAKPPPLPPPLPKRPKPEPAPAAASEPAPPPSGGNEHSGLSGLLEEEHQRRKEAEAREKALAERLEAMKGLEEALAKSSAELETSEADRRDLARALAEVESQVPDLQQELHRERKALADLRQELEAAQQASSAAESSAAAVASAEQQLGMLRRERDGLADQLRAVEEMAEVLHTQLKDFSDRHEQHEQEKATLLAKIAALESARADAPRPDELKRLRAELVVVKKKWMILQRERDEAKAAPGPTTTVSSDELEVVRKERDQLRADAASMKRKLIAAESALEMVASLRAKIARLEAQARK